MQSIVTSLQRSPALPVFAGVCASFLCYDADFPVFLCPFLGLLVVSGVIFLSSGNVVRRFWIVFSLALAFSLGISFFCLAGIDRKEVGSRHIDIGGYVVSERPWGAKRAVIVSSSEGRFMVLTSASKALKEGDGIEIRGVTLPFRKTSAENVGFREDVYWKSKGVVSELIPESIKVLPPSPFSIHYWRSLLRGRILLSVPGKTRGYILASWLGVKDPELVKSHTAFGTVHLLAVSGFHVAIVVSGLFFLFRKMAAREIFISLFLWIYVALTGFSASALRAALMLQLILVSSLIGRPVAPVNSVSVAGLALLVINPYCFWNLGWRLSMVASMTIASVAQMDIDKKTKCFVVAPLVWLTTAGLTVSAFGKLSLSGAILNIIAIPLFGILLPLASGITLLGLLGVSIGGYIYLISEIPFSIWDRFAHIFVILLPYVDIPAWLVVYPSAFVFLTVIFLGISDSAFIPSVLASGVVTSFLAFISGWIVV